MLLRVGLLICITLFWQTSTDVMAQAKARSVTQAKARSVTQANAHSVTQPTDRSMIDAVCKVGGAPHWYPVYFRENDSPSGVMSDVLSAISRETGITFEFDVQQPWPWSLHRLEKGELDILAGAFYTVDRSHRYVYSVPVFKGHVHIFTKKSRGLSIQSLDDLAGLHGLRPLGGSYGESFDRYAEKNLHLTGVSPKATMLKMLLRERTDYLVMMQRDGKEELVKPEFADKIVMHDKPQIPIDIYLLFSKHSDCLAYLDQINSKISELQLHGKIDEFESNYQLE